MWNFNPKGIAGNSGLNDKFLTQTPDALDCSDNDISSPSREEGFECPICMESFNIVENVPYILWCGHTLCKNCMLGLQWAVIKFPTSPVQLPLFISCPWCNLLSPRLVYRGDLKFPRKNFFLLWMIESMNGDRGKSHSVHSGDHDSSWPSNTKSDLGSQESYSNKWRSLQSESSRSNHDHSNLDNYLTLDSLHSSLRRSPVFFLNLTAKFPLVLIFLMLVFYAIPASAAILVLYSLITVLFAVPSFLMLYFSYPTLDWLVKEIMA